MIEGWRLGRVEHVTACVNVPLRQLSAGQHDHWMFRDFGNIVMEQAPHSLSQIQALLGPIQNSSASVSGLTQLRTGVPFYDTWQVSLECERGTAQLFLAFGREYQESSLHVIGQDGSAFVDLRRNTLRVADKSRFIEPADNLRDALQNARASASQGIANFLGYGLGFLQLRPPADAFSLSIATSVGRFYEALQQGKEPAMGLEEGAGIVRACESIVQDAARSLNASRREEREHVTGT
jgi:predicted dehydrogenase